MPLPRPEPGTLKWWVIGTIGIGLGVALAIWFGLSATVGKPTWQTVSYKVVDNESVRVEFEATSPDGRPLVCTIRALREDFGVVGSTDVTVAFNGADSTRHSATVRTTSRAVTGTVDRCDFAP